MSERWIANKFGLFDFWYYDEEEFELSNGKIIFRGTNGSGKSVTTQSFIPLLLDGDKRPSRLDPFGSSARKIENYLLINDDVNDKIAYLYMEFVKPATNTYLTIGIGFRARRGKKLDCWHFILKDGRRINKDFMLYKRKGGEKFALTSTEFKNLLGEGNVYTTSQQEYMEKVNEHLFGYSDIDNYKDLLKLLIQIRSPKLSKEFKPTVIYDILTSSLSVLSEDDLRTMSEAMDNMDSLNNKLDELKRSLEATDKIKNAFHKYNLNKFYNKSRNYYSQKAEVKNLNIEINEINRKIKEKEDEIESNKEILVLYEKQLSAAKIKEETLRNGEGFDTRDKLFKNEEDLKELKKAYLDKKEKYDNKNDLVIKKKDESKTIDLLISRIESEIKGLIDDEEYYREESYIQEDYGIKNILKNEEFIFDDIKSSINEYSRLVTEAYNLILQFDNVKKELSYTEEERDKKDAEVKTQENKFKESLGYLTNIKSEYIENINDYLNNTDELKIDENNLINIFKEINNIKEIADCSKIINTIKYLSEPIKNDFISNKLVLENKFTNIKEEITNIRNEITKIENSKEIIEEDENTAKCKSILEDNKIPYEYFYKCINFNEDVEEITKKAIEGSLFNMGILNSFIIPIKYKEKAEELLKEYGHKLIFSDNNSVENNIKKYFTLENTDFTQDFKSEIEGILDSISLVENNINKTFISENFIYGIGILKGASKKDYSLKYIGLESRESFRKLKIQELKMQQEQKENEMNNCNDSINFVKGKIIKLENEISIFPSTIDMETGIKFIEEDEKKLKHLEEALNSLQDKLMNVKKNVDELNLKVFNATEYIKIPKNKESYDNAIKGIMDYREIINNLSEKYLNLNHKKSDMARVKESIDETIVDIDSIYGELIDYKNKISYKENTIKALKETLLKLNLGEIEKEYEEVTIIINSYPEKISNIKESIIRREENIKKLNEKTIEVNEKLSKKNEVLELYKNIVEEELSLKYINELDELSLDEAVIYIIKNYENYNISQKEGLLEKLYAIYNKFSGALGDYGIKYVSIFDQYKESEDEDINKILNDAIRTDIKVKFNKKEISIYALAEYLEGNIEWQSMLINERERDVFENTLIDTLSTKINAKIHLANSWVNQINKLMEGMNTSNGLKLSLKWVPRKANSEEELDIRELTKILGTPQFMSNEEKERVSNHFKERLKKKKRTVEEDGITRSYQGIISDVLDYRQWFDFELWYSKPMETKKELTDNAFFRLSGGEKAMAMYIPLFAAVNARYNGAGKKDSPRIIALDEAFAGVDEQNISYMFELIESLKLDYVLNSQVLWGTYESVKSLAIYELIRQGEDVVLPIKYHWNGKVKIMETTT